VSDEHNHPILDPAALMAHTATIVAGYVAGNPVPPAELPQLIRQVHATLSELAGTPDVAFAAGKEPAVPIEDSVTDDFIICLEDGKELKMLKRYLRTQYGLTPEEYRARWNLPADYPMVAPNYAAKRSEVAKSMGLGETPDKRGVRGPAKKSG
jgi:predicted transcriptional regulator